MHSREIRRETAPLRIGSGESRDIQHVSLRPSGSGATLSRTNTLPELVGGSDLERAGMQRIDGNYLYVVGSQIHPLSGFSAFTVSGSATTFDEALYPLIVAERALEPLLLRSVFRLRTSFQAGQALLKIIRDLRAKIEAAPDKKAEMDYGDIFGMQSAVSAFEAVLGAELGQLPLYVVTQKAGFDTATLIESGALCFPIDVLTKAEDAVPDLEQATRCIAYELPTAAGFHLHRANEAILHKYWDAVTHKAKRPASRNMGDYLNEMNQKNVGDAKVKSALKDLKDLHRNPLIHPEDSLNMDEAIALMNGIYTVMVHMLKEIPVPGDTLDLPFDETQKQAPPVKQSFLTGGRKVKVPAESASASTEGVS